MDELNVKKMNVIVESFRVIGRLVKDAEIVESKDGSRKGLVFPIAVNHSYRDEKGELVKQTNYYDTAKWYSDEQIIKKQLSFLKKGALVSVVGFPKARGYMSKDNTPEAKITITVSQYSVLNFINSLPNEEGEDQTKELVDEPVIEELVEEVED